MVLKYNVNCDDKIIVEQIERLTNRIYKLLPSREEGADWQTPLQSLTLETAGMFNLVEDQLDMFSLLCKLESLSNLKEEEDFLAFRKTIFECLNLMGRIKDCLD